MSTSVELFTGAGGLALGLHRAGFEHLLLVEHSSKACATLRHNFRRSLRGGGCELHEGDVRGVSFARFAGEVDVLAAGASCQPFSIGGLHRSHVDDRNVFPAVFRAQREAGPKAVIVENVKGLVRAGFSDYVRYIELQLAMPELPGPDDDGPEAWRHHLPKLLKASRGSRRAQGRVRYVVRRAVMNAADHGIGQHRERVFFVALRADLHRAWDPPVATHGRDRLLFDQYVTGAYWKRHELDARCEPAHLRNRIQELAKQSDPPPLKPWVTLRDWGRAPPGEMCIRHPSGGRRRAAAPQGVAAGPTEQRRLDQPGHPDTGVRRSREPGSTARGGLGASRLAG